MKTYIGTKIIQAEPMDRRTFHNTIRKFSGWPEEAPTEDGYKVMYPDGYESWSPKAVFEAAYREVTAEEQRLLIDRMYIREQQQRKAVSGTFTPEEKSI